MLIVVSLLTPSPPADKLTGLTYASPVVEVQPPHPVGWRKLDLLLSLLLVVFVAALWLYFS